MKEKKKVTVEIEKALYIRLRGKLIKQGMSMRQWVEEKAKQEFRKHSDKPDATWSREAIAQYAEEKAQGIAD